MAVKYTKAPISELVCGVIFNSNILLDNGALFKILSSLVTDFPIIHTHPIGAEDEVVNGMIQATMDYSKAGFSTYRLISKETKWQVILQQNLVTFHWVRQDNESVGNYPGFQTVLEKFIKIFDRIKEAIQNPNIDSKIKSYYLRYTDRVNLEQYKEKGLNISDIINISAPLFELRGKKYSANNYFNRYSIPCDDINGYSIISVNSPTVPGIGQFLVVENILKGYNPAKSDIKGWFDVSHDIQVSFFENFFKKQILDSWI